MEPGAFRTNFLTTDTTQFITPSNAYKSPHVVADVISRFEGMNGSQAGDPTRGVARIFETVVGEGAGRELKEKKYLRLLIGQDCWDRASKQVEKMRENVAACREVAGSTGF